MCLECELALLFSTFLYGMTVVVGLFAVLAIKRLYFDRKKEKERELKTQT